MREKNWWTKAVIYELYVDKFNQNFQGLTAKLDYLTYLGIDTIWILPHYPSPLVDGGYDISDYQGVRPDLGTLDDFHSFVDAAHQKGLKVIIDLVLNHTSDMHPWFIEARSSKSNPKRDWYLWNSDQSRFPGAFVHFAEIKGNNWIPNPATGDFYYASFYPGQPDLNWDNPEVFSAMLGVIDFWLDRGVDGFRLDAVSRLIKRDNTNCFALPETHAILKKIRTYIDSKYSHILLMAETGGWPDEARTFFGAGDECQLVIHFPMSVKILTTIFTKNIDGVNELWNRSGGLPSDCRWAIFLTSHDTVDVFFLPDQNERQLLIDKANPGRNFSQSLSESFGGRLGEICQGSKENIIWATQKLLSQPGTPIIYYGNEIGMRNAVLSEKPGDARAFVRNNFDWEEMERQKSDPESVLNQIRTSLLKRSS
jgi:maltose alpha-D-glucosyltransferase/alpha-amylase